MSGRTSSLCRGLRSRSRFTCRRPASDESLQWWTGTFCFRLLCSQEPSVPFRPHPAPISGQMRGCRMAASSTADATGRWARLSALPVAAFWAAPSTAANSNVVRKSGRREKDQLARAVLPKPRTVGVARYRPISLCIIAVALSLGDPKPGDTGAIDRSAPGGELFETQPISLTSFVEAQQSAVDRGQHLGFAPADPVCCCRGWQILQRQRAQWSHDRRWPCAFEHREFSIRTACAASCAPQLKSAGIGLRKACGEVHDAMNRSMSTARQGYGSGLTRR